MTRARSISNSARKPWTVSFTIATLVAVYAFLAPVSACFAADDEVKVSSGDKIYLDVLANDNLGPGAIVDRLSQQPDRGRAEIRDNGRAILYFAPDKYDGTVKFRYVAKSSATEPNATTGEFTVEVTVGENIISDVQYSQVAKILLFLLVFSTVLETGLATLFNWRWYILIAEARGLKTPTAVLVSGIFVYTYGFDAVSEILTAFGPEQVYGKTLMGQFITALILAGGSGAVNVLFQNMGLRSPFRQQEIVQQRNKNSYLKISVTREQVPATEPITVSVDGELIGSIEAGKNRGGWPLGWPIKPGQREIVVSGLDSEKQVVTKPDRKTFAAGQAVTISLAL